MPLIQGSSQKSVSENIRRERSVGKPERQSIAIALDVARRAKRANGGPTFSKTPHPGGLLHSHVAGRTDHLPVTVKSGSYVIPADIVSALGEGNTLNGRLKLDKMFKRSAPKIKGGDHVPIMAAGGEYIILPEEIIARFGNLKTGHDTLDAFVKAYRAKTIKKLKGLPGPAKGDQ